MMLDRDRSVLVWSAYLSGWRTHCRYRPLYRATAPSVLTICEMKSTLVILPMLTRLAALCWIRRILHSSAIQFDRVSPRFRGHLLQAGTHLILSDGITATIHSMQPAPIPALYHKGIHSRFPMRSSKTSLPSMFFPGVDLPVSLSLRRPLIASNVKNLVPAFRALPQTTGTAPR